MKLHLLYLVPGREVICRNSEEFGWESLADRRWARRFFQLYKIYNDISPPCTTIDFFQDFFVAISAKKSYCFRYMFFQMISKNTYLKQ